MSRSSRPRRSAELPILHIRVSPETRWQRWWQALWQWLKRSPVRSLPAPQPSDERIAAEPNNYRFIELGDFGDEMAIHLAPPTVEVSDMRGRLSVGGYGPPATAIKVVFPDGSADLTWADEHGRYAVMCRHAQPRGTVSVTVLNANGYPGLTAVNRYFGASAPRTQAARLVSTGHNGVPKEPHWGDFADTVV